MNKLETLDYSISKATKIAIFSHIAPDADALCSSFALKNIIKNNYDGKFVDCFFDGALSELYAPILRDEVINPKPFSSYDLAFIMDCPNLARTGECAKLASQIPVIINIDHHESNEKFGVVNFTTSHVSSTCEMLYLIAKKMNYDLNTVIAKNIYQGIITDTNCFTSSTLTCSTHAVLSDLLKFKFDADAIRNYYFKNASTAKTKLLMSAFRSLKFYKQGQLATMKIPFEQFSKYDAVFEDTMGIVDNGLNIAGVKVSAIFIEREPGSIYVSLRSNGEFDVGEVATANNGGGSHTISAYQTTGTVKEAESLLSAQLIEKLPDIVEEKDILF